MSLAVLKPLSKPAVLGWIMLFAAHANADTITYQAATDFPVTTSGEVPYYVDEGRQALAIDAAVEEYRDQFAKAEVVFDGQPGTYQITLVAIAENDGEADYRLSINDEIVALASNPEVVDVFASVRHDLATVELPAGAVIAIESLANSNGKIPENGEFAFARGRWTALELSATEAQSTSSPDLAVLASITNQSLQVGDDAEISVSISNAAESEVATGVALLISLADGLLELADESVCTTESNGFRCPVAEIPAGGLVQLAVNTRTKAEATAVPVTITAVADQSDFDTSNNSVELTLTVAKARDSSSNSNSTDSDGGSLSLMLLWLLAGACVLRRVYLRIS